MDIFQAYHLLQAHSKGRFWHPRRSRIPQGRWDFQHFRWTGCRFHLGRKPLAFHIRLLSKQHPLRNPSSPVTGATPFRNFENTQLRLPIRVEKHTRFHMLIRNQCEANTMSISRSEIKPSEGPSFSHRWKIPASLRACGDARTHQSLIRIPASLQRVSLSM